MTQQEIQDEINKRNSDIALMLGYVNTTPTDKDFNIFEHTTKIGKIPKMIETMSMRFHSDWNWLMEAVEFIRLLNWSYDMYCPSNTDNSDGEFECNFWDKINPEIEGRSKNSLKEAVFIAVSNFAKKFNNMDYIPKEETKCTCKEHDPYCCQVHGTCPTCVKKEELKTNLERLSFLGLIKEFAEYYKKVPLVEEPKQECTCENPTDNTCGYCEKENKIKILEEAKKRALEEETLEEAAENMWLDPIQNLTSKMSFIQGAKWQTERMYSEEDLRNAYRWGTLVNQGTKEHFNEWFNQFKKK